MITSGKADTLVLLAEDSDDDAFFFQRALKKACVACSLIRAENGKVAIDLIENGAASGGPLPALLFLDLKMPVMSGFDVLEWLRSAPIHPKPKVIVLSGSNDQADQVRARALGALDYLVKPITPDILLEKLQIGLRGAGSLRAESGVIV